MAGSYPDAPDRRIAYDTDGTIVWSVWSTVGASWSQMQWSNLAEVSTAGKEGLNSEGVGGAGLSGGYPNNAGAGWVFPEPRDITGFNAYASPASPFGDHLNSWEWSADSPNGVAGTFNEFWGPGSYPHPSLYSWENWFRINIRTPTTTVTAARVFRVGIGGGTSSFPGHLNKMHLYGSINSAYTPDRLLFIDNDTGLEYDAPQDWGDVPRGTVLSHDIKMKNNSSTLTANTITLSFEALTGTSNTWYQIKETGGAYGSTLNITSIAAGATYPAAANVITVKLDVGDTAQFGLQTARIRAATTSWT